VIEEELGGTFVPVEMGTVPTLLYACAGEQVSRFLEPALEGSRRPVLAVREPGSGGVNPENWTTSATPDSQGFILNGQKTLAASPGVGDFYILLAKTPEGLTAFLLDVDLTNLQTSTNGKFVLTLGNCRVPGEALLGQPGGALELVRDEAPRNWIQMGARYVGMVERLIEMSAEHARSWISLGEPLAVRPAVQRMLAEMRVDVESARWLVYHAAWLADNSKDDSFHGPAAQVRLATGEMLKRAIDRATMIFAGPGPAPQIEPHLLVKSLARLALELLAAGIAIAAWRPAQFNHFG
jgi:acyl-CoA dehydrogenase